jgi:hypothetical protein
LLGDLIKLRDKIQERIKDEWCAFTKKE